MKGNFKKNGKVPDLYSEIDMFWVFCYYCFCLLLVVVVLAGVEGEGGMVFRQVRDMEMWREERRSGEIEGREKENGNCPIRQKTPLN